MGNQLKKKGKRHEKDGNHEQPDFFLFARNPVAPQGNCKKHEQNQAAEEVNEEVFLVKPVVNKVDGKHGGRKEKSVYKSCATKMQYCLPVLAFTNYIKRAFFLFF